MSGGCFLRLLGKYERIRSLIEDLDLTGLVSAQVIFFSCGHVCLMMMRRAN